MTHRSTPLILISCWTCLALAQAVPSSNPQPTTAQPLSLGEAVRIALQQHPALKEAEAAVDAAEAEVRVARSSYFPQLSFSGIGKVGLSGATNALGLTGFPASPFFRNTAYSLNWYQSVFDFGRTKHFVASHRAMARSAALRRLSEEQRITLDVKRAYFSVLEAQQLREVADETVKTRALTAERARAYYRTELGSKLDLSLAEASLAEAQGVLIHARNSVETAFAALRLAMGVENTQTYTLQRPPFETITVPMIDSLIHDGLIHRPDEQALESKIIALSENLGLARSQSLPDIRGFAAGGQARFNGTTVKEEQRHGVGALGVLVPIFTGGRLKAERDEARAELAGAEATRDELRQRIRLEITEAYYQLADLAERIPAAYQQQQAAREALDLAQARQKVQLGSFLDVLTAELAATNAQANYAREQFDYERAKARLDFAIGRSVHP
jgi:outer membrane protein TolC